MNNDRIRKLTLVLVSISTIVTITLVFINLSNLTIANISLAGLLLLFSGVILTGIKFFDDLDREVRKLSNTFGLINEREKNLVVKVKNAVNEIERRYQAFLPEIIELKRESREDLVKALEGIANRAYVLLKCRTVELTLYSGDNSKYHSSFVIGHPLSTYVTAADNSEKDFDILVENLMFAGTVLGTISVVSSLRESELDAKREILHVLALQGTMAIVNSRYTDEIMRLQRYSDESIKAKTGFLANLSHELRGPLGIIMNAVEIVLDGLCGEINKRQKELLSMVNREGQHLLELVNDVLDYAKSESGKVTPKPVSILVSEILKDISNVVRTQVHQKKQKLHTVIPDDIGGILCDRRHIRQILINLLTNAVKYTPEEGTIELICERAPANRIKILVKDTGIGIDPRDHHKVFAPFERIENSYTLEQVGTGLGMPLTKRLVEANNGTITFKSSLGIGSEFWITLPAERIHQEDKEQPREVKSIKRGNGEIILLVDPEKQTGDLLTTYLTHHGYRIEPLQDLREALSNEVNQKAAILMINNSLIDQAPEELSKFRLKETIRHLPIIALTSRAFDFDTERYLSIGIDRCISKPIEFNELATALNELLHSIKDRELSAR